MDFQNLWNMSSSYFPMINVNVGNVPFYATQMMSNPFMMNNSMGMSNMYQMDNFSNSSNMFMSPDMNFMNPYVSYPSDIYEGASNDEEEIDDNPWDDISINLSTFDADAYLKKRISCQKINIDYLKNSTFNFKDVSYNKDIGVKLAKFIANHAHRFRNKCAKYVRIALQDVGLLPSDFKPPEAAYEYINILKNNDKFTHMIINNQKDMEELPAGCVIVYDKGVCNYSRKYGHIEVTLGDGKAAGDGITNNIRCGQNGVHVFVPKKQST